MKHSLVLLLAITSSVRGAEGDKPKLEKQQYVIFQVSTALQKELSRPGVRYVVVINGDTVLTKEGKLITKYLDVSALPKLDVKKGDEI
jgi:hypothetical protein